jgi:uncharacterized RDD family membrane protein YckC
MRRSIAWMSMLAALLLPGLFGGPASVAAAGDVLAAADGRHVYVVRPGVEESGWEVVHLDARTGPAQFRTVFRTPRRPEAIAAIGDRCLLVLAPFDATRPTPLVLSFRVAQHPLNDVWFADPPGDPRVLPPLPAGGELAGMAATSDGELVVHRPSQRVARGVVRTSGPEKDRSGADRTGEADPTTSPETADPGMSEGIGEAGAIHVLAAPARMDWVAVEPPPAFQAAIDLAVGRMLLDGRPVPALVWRSADDVRRLAAWGGSGWRTPAIDGLPDWAPVSLITVDGRSLLSVRDRDGGLAMFDLVRDVKDAGDAAASGGYRARAFTRAGADVVGPRSTVVGTEGGPWIIGLDGAEVRVSTVDRVDGSISTPVVAVEQEVGGSLVEYPIYAGLVMVIMTATFILRPHIERQPAVPAEGLSPAGLLRRAAGLCIDLAPGLMLAIVVFDLEPSVFAEDLRAGDPNAMMPAIFAMVVASAITIGMEMATARSLGKWVVGIRVAALDGSSGTVRQRGLRAALRLVLLLFWPVAMLALLDPAGRGVPELLTRTVVLAGRRPEPTAVGSTVDLDA